MNKWQRVGIVSPGGTVFGITTDRSGLTWLATEIGIFCQGDGASWQPLRQGQPLSPLSALTSVGLMLVAGSSQGQIVYSNNRGDTWYQGQISQVNQQPISWLAASPNFENDRVILAGTDGAGILRSTDGGRTWRWANFGLQDFAVIALAVAPEWGRREFVFAATVHGFYRSPNGGRAWKPSDAGIENAGVQSVAVSPGFSHDRTLFVGTEATGIYRSTDRGKSWRPCNQGLFAVDGTGDVLPSINCLWLHPNFATTPICVAGTADGQLFYSADGGTSWQQVSAGHASVLGIGGSGLQLYAGLHDQGLLRSDDGGQTWLDSPQLAARLITRLVAGPENYLYSFGLWDGVWHSADGGASWRQGHSLASQAPLFFLTASPLKEQPFLLVGTNSGLVRSDDHGQTWQTVADTRWGTVTSLTAIPQFSADQQLWAGTSSGEVLFSTDAGLSWSRREAPKRGDSLVSLVLFPESMATVVPGKKADGGVLAAATYNPHSQQITLWYSTTHGAKWIQWLQATANWPSAQFASSGRRVVVCVDRRCWRTTAAGWEQTFEADRPIVRLGRTEAGGLLALTSRQMLYSADGANWSWFSEGLEEQGLLDFALAPDGQLTYALTTGGVVWRRNV